MKTKNYGLSGDVEMRTPPKVRNNPCMSARVRNSRTPLSYGISAFGPAAVEAYKSERVNGRDEDAPPAMPFPRDGTFAWETPAADRSKVRYTAGIGDEEWMRKRDWNYLVRLVQENKLDEIEPRLQTEVPSLYEEIIKAKFTILLGVLSNPRPLRAQMGDLLERSGGWDLMKLAFSPELSEFVNQTCEWIYQYKRYRDTGERGEYSRDLVRLYGHLTSREDAALPIRDREAGFHYAGFQPNRGVWHSIRLLLAVYIGIAKETREIAAEFRGRSAAFILDFQQILIDEIYDRMKVLLLARYPTQRGRAGRWALMLSIDGKSIPFNLSELKLLDDRDSGLGARVDLIYDVISRLEIGQQIRVASGYNSLTPSSARRSRDRGAADESPFECHRLYIVLMKTAATTVDIRIDNYGDGLERGAEEVSSPADRGSFERGCFFVENGRNYMPRYRPYVYSREINTALKQYINNIVLAGYIARGGGGRSGRDVALDLIYDAAFLTPASRRVVITAEAYRGQIAGNCALYNLSAGFAMRLGWERFGLFRQCATQIVSQVRAVDLSGEEREKFLEEERTRASGLQRIHAVAARLR